MISDGKVKNGNGKEKQSIAVAERCMQSTEERWQGAESKCGGGEKH